MVFAVSAMNTPSRGSRDVAKQERDHNRAAGREALPRKQKGRRSFDRRPNDFRFLTSDFRIQNSEFRM